MTPVDDDLQGFKDDLDSIRSGGSSSGGNGGSGGRNGPVGKDDVPDLGLGNGDGNMPEWAKRGIYAALIVAIITIYVPFRMPDGTVLVAAALAFLVLGLWAGAKRHAELAAAWERFEEWRE